MNTILKSFDAGHFLVEIVKPPQTGCEHHDEHQCLIRIRSVREDVLPKIDALVCLCDASELLGALVQAVKEAAQIEEG